MTKERFETLVRRLEGDAAKAPGLYRLRVTLLAALGYAYLLAVLAALMAAVGLLVMALVYGRHGSYPLIKLAWILGAFAAMVLRSLWVPIPPPAGLWVERKDAPRLFDLLDEVSRAVRAPRFRRVLISPDFNAAVAQRPRLGMLGWSTNTLVLGLPLMQALSPAHFRAVVAHEMGHLSANHGRLSVWVYRVRQTWSQLLERLHESRHWGTFVFDRFLGWYAPFFDAYSFVLIRAQEYHADRCSCQLAGVPQAIEAQVRVAVQARALAESFWPGLFRQADDRPSPPADLFGAMSSCLCDAHATEEGRRWLAQAWAEKTDCTDTHPSLRDRLAAMGNAADSLPPIPPAPEESAAERYLGDLADGLSRQLALFWRAEMAPSWEARYNYVQEARHRLRVLDAREEPLTDDEAWERARLAADVREPAVAVPLLRAYLEDHPEHAGAHFALGRLLIEGEDEAGVAHLEAAMARDPDAVLPGCELLERFLRRQGRTGDAERVVERAAAHQDLLRRAHEERDRVTDRDPFQPHALPPECVAALCERLAGYDRIAAAFLVRKPTTLLPERPFYVLGIRLASAWYRLDSGDGGEIANQLASQLALPGDACVLLLGRENRSLEKALARVDGACIYRRAG